MKTKATATSATSAAIVRRKKYPRPPPLASEIALMQFADGGSMDDNIKRFMEARAKATGAAGISDVYRDGDGGIWLDQDEQLEYTHLLAECDESRPRSSADLQWVKFGDKVARSPGDERRGTVWTQDFDLDPKYTGRSVAGDDLAFRSAFIPPVTCKPNKSVLCVPSRPHRAAKHLQKSEFLVDVAPLKLSPSSPAFDLDKARQGYFDSNFNPLPVTQSTPVDVRTRRVGSSRAIDVPSRTVNDGLMSSGRKKKPLVMNMTGLFRSGERKS